MEKDNPHKLRLVIYLIILTLSLISLIILQIHKSGFWVYTSLMSVVVALLCTGQNVYCTLKDKKHKGLVWRQILYWLGFLAAIYIDSLLLQYGVTSSVQSGLFALITLSLALYIIGVTHDIPFALVGVTIALMVTGSIIIKSYLLFVIIPLAVIMGFIIFLLISKNKSSSE